MAHNKQKLIFIGYISDLLKLIEKEEDNDEVLTYLNFICVNCGLLAESIEESKAVSKCEVDEGCKHD